MALKMLYNNFSGYLRNKYHRRIKKICIDGGFTCPNRDGSRGTGGCSFCGERGAGEHIDASLSVSEQVRRFLRNEHRADGFIAYFQSFTNTYAPVEVLRERYDAALADGRIMALAVGTRPDCINEENAALLSSYTERCDVWVELGLQTSNDRTAELINRCYSSREFTEAVDILKKYGIPVVVHIIIGLPGETAGDVAETVEFVNDLGLWGIKIHSAYVMKGTELERMYDEGGYIPLTLEEYADSASYVLAHISPDMVVHRITGDCPRELLAAPEWNGDKNRVIAEINRRMEEMNWRQGCLYRRR